MTVLAGAGPTGDDPDGPDSRHGGYDTRWLDLRAAADDRSRSADLLDGLPRVGRHLLDVGCGTGAMQRWCDARRTASGAAPVRWTLLDPDDRLLAVASQRAGRATTLRRGTVADLSQELLHDVDAVVCSALLDVLTASDLDHLVRTVVAAGVPLLAALTVTGAVTLSPAHPDDVVARAAVDRAATASAAAGPGALAAVRAAARENGAGVLGRDTSWHLRPGTDDDLLAAWGAGYVAAAVRHAPAPGRLQRWAADRSARLSAGGLHAVVAHEDVLLLPGALDRHLGTTPGAPRP